MLWDDDLHSYDDLQARLMKPSSKITSRMCSLHFLSLGLCFLLKNSTTRPCGFPVCPYGCENATFHLMGLQACCTVRDTRPCGFPGWPCELPGLSTRPQGVPYTASVVCPCKLVSHGQVEF
ncbi:unnamed protein product [Linum trigynum]|uniref:Uncharacterized protein n=1 Tax=Linum trigynum TaxID=586398 RepID=A0AAV2CBB1_9ROSI